LKSLFLISIVLAAIAIPYLTARDPNPRRGVRRMAVLVLVFNVAYLVYLALVHTTFFVPQW
jgi:hypothetical protein